jgi:hypothetical protein
METGVAPKFSMIWPTTRENALARPFRSANPLIGLRE